MGFFVYDIAMLSYLYPGDTENIHVGGSYHLMSSGGSFVHVVVLEKYDDLVLGRGMHSGMMLESIDGGTIWLLVPNWQGCYETCL